MASRYLKFGKFGFILTSICSLTWFIDGMQISLASLVANSIRYEWNLTHFQTAFVSSTTFAGMGFAAPLTGLISDKIGRKPVLSGCLLLISYTSFLSVTAPNPFWFALLRFITGIGLTCIITGPCYISEYFDYHYRGFCTAIINVGFAFGVAYTSFIAYLLNDRYGWRTYILLLNIIIPFVFMTSLWLPESIKYLQSVNDYEGIQKTLHRVSMINGETMSSSSFLTQKATDNSKESKYNLIIRKYFFKILLSVILFVSQMTLYYGAVFLSNEILFNNPACHDNIPVRTNNTSSKSHENKYLYPTLTTLGDIIGLLIGMPFIGKTDRRKLVAVLSLLNSASFITSNFCVSQNLLAFVIFLSRASSSVSFTATYAIIAETFNTKIRATALGLCNFSARLVSVGIPFLVQWLLYKSYVSTYAIFLVCSALSVICSLCLPKVNVNDDIG